ncbi:putative response regulator/sigma54 interaction protein [Prevotella sp. DNF00663]|uniref:sigma-54-dependent transcriptional regulator n=1 Tax=unclassified Prevotella TaxID=2638335 RepID=UPI000512E07E|nr:MULTISPECIES: sigma-54 dependent transcriptional regulator [unclassified Prevotella]KGI61004.1 chemotaxis protein CheY [Prevotella sp. S7 MS 2]KXB83977.1 putative response regulator/sigma54 interaction protein [Prevotella sp. DNF00663]
MILIIDDDITIRSSLNFMLKRAGMTPLAVSNATEAMDMIRSQGARLQLILMDMNFSLSTSGDEGLTLLRQVKLFLPHIPIILMTAWGSIDLAVKGMRAGAFDFITKPWNNASLLQRIETALQMNDIPQTEAPNDFPEIIGKSRALRECLDMVARVAKTQASVLITGESGTGKELIAEAIHRNSSRTKKPFVKVNLGGISQSLFESEMFGHRKGAFTDAQSDRIGRFEMADKGTIFLDEIGDLDMASQVKLLRVLQDQTFEPLGDSRPRKVDIRVVSATNADLPSRINERRFREDLFYRINLITIHLPSLSERREDIPLLVNHFAAQVRSVDIAPEAMDMLSEQNYSGNIRELKNLVERTIIISDKDYLTANDFQLGLKHGDRIFSSESNGTLADAERARIEQAMQLFGGNITRVAAHLGITRQALYRRLEKYNKA